MPETAKILRFPQSNKARGLSSAEIACLCRRYLDSPLSERSEELVEEVLGDPDAVLALLTQLRAVAERSPRLVAQEVIGVYENLVRRDSLGFFDERDYFIGEYALLAGSVLRLLGRRDEAEIWLDRAEGAFRHVINPGPALANTAYARLTLHYDSGRYERALESLPSLTQSFLKLNMDRERLKCRFLQAMCLKNSQRRGEAREELESMNCEPTLGADAGLHGMVLLNLGDLETQDGNPRAALELYRRALPLVQDSDQAFAAAHLKGLIAEALRADGNLSPAVQAFRSAIGAYLALGMNTWVAYLRVVLSETLIALSRHREAEWEILAALPTIDEQKMVPEGFAAVALLRESVRRRETDQSALRELKEALQARS